MQREELSRVLIGGLEPRPIVHVRCAGDPEVARHLRFRDRLRASAADRAAYEALERSLAARDWEDVNFYAQAKDELIEAILARGHERPVTR